MRRPESQQPPVLAGRSCALAEPADVLVYDVWASGTADGSRMLIENIRELHPDAPVVLTHPGLELSWEEGAGAHAVTPLVGQPTGARLHEAIQAALASRRSSDTRRDEEAIEHDRAAWPEDVLQRLASS